MWVSGWFFKGEDYLEYILDYFDNFYNSYLVLLNCDYNMLIVFLVLMENLFFNFLLDLYENNFCNNFFFNMR